MSTRLHMRSPDGRTVVFTTTKTEGFARAQVYVPADQPGVTEPAPDGTPFVVTPDAIIAFWMSGWTVTDGNVALFMKNMRDAIPHAEDAS